jgi:signal transduction histidine kinase
MNLTSLQWWSYVKPHPHRTPRGLARLFGDLRVRPKLIVLHNTFFLILACAVYFSVIPMFEERAANTRARENSLLVQIFSDDRPLPRLPETEIYNFQEGTAEALSIPYEIRQWLQDRPGETWRDRSQSEFAYRQLPWGSYRKMRMPDIFHDDTIRKAQINLFVVLGVIYTLAVITLEFLVMPQYVYEPIRKVLRADRATQEGNREGELIREEEILDDEIGQIMRSRNATVSELRKHEDELARALAQLEKTAEDLRLKNVMLENQDRLASIGLLSASVAHEMNTPLTVLHGSIEKMLLRVTSRLRTISESLLDFARPRKTEVGPVEIRGILEEAWGLLAIDDKASGVRFTNCVDARHLVTGNTDRLVQVFLNLLRNALNAVPEQGGTITAHSRQIEEAGRGWVLIDVEDNGSGISPDVLPGIFDAFVTTRLDANGTGLGLTVSEAIVRQHGGSIMASNCPQGGARLEVRLPADG